MINRYQKIDAAFATLGDDNFLLPEPIVIDSGSKLNKVDSIFVTNQSCCPKTSPAITVVESKNDERNSSFLRSILATVFLSLAILCGYYALPTTKSVAVPSGTTQIEKRYVTKNIEDIQVGDEIYAYNTDTGSITHRKVTSVLEHSSDHLRYLEIHDVTGRTQIFETTDVHPFWVITDTLDLSRAAEENVEDNGIIFYHENIESNINGFYVAAKNLLIGDRFIAPDGTVSSLKNSWRVEYPDGISVYNFEVEGEHNYFVIANYEALKNGALPVLAHNARECGGNLVRIGQAGELAAKIIKNTKAYGINNRTRIPDEVTNTMITEVKNVRYQHLSTQIKDLIDLAKNLQKKFRLITKKDTKLSQQIKEKIEHGEIIHETF